MRDLLEKWRLAPAVRALMAMKGFQTVAAMILVSELGEVHRFGHPRQVMAYLGLVPTENTSSDRRRQGHITKCGNAHARWLLVECAQHYASPAQSKQGTEPAPGRSIARRCGPSVGERRTGCTIATRVCLARRLQRNKAIVAIARELCGFIWELLRTQALLPGAIHIGLKSWFEGNSTNQQGGDTTQAHRYTHKPTQERI